MIAAQNRRAGARPFPAGEGLRRGAEAIACLVLGRTEI